MRRMIARFAVALSVFALVGCDGWDDEAQFRIASSEISRDLALANGATDVNQLPQIDPASRASGSAGAFSRAFKAFMIHVIADRRSYRQESDAVGLAAATSPVSVASPGGLARARAAIAQSRSINVKYRALNQQRIAEVRQQMRNSVDRSSTVAAFEKGLDGSLASQGGTVAEVFNSEATILDELDRTLDDLERSKGRWRGVGNRRMFERDADLAAFDGHVRAVQVATAAEQAVMARARQQTAASAGQLHDLSKP